MAASLRLLFLFVAAVAAEELFPKKGSAIEHLTTTTFDRTLAANSTAAIVLFYAPYCQHSKKFAPLFTRAANSFKGVLRLAVVDCSDTSSHDLCRRVNIRQFPTIKLFSPEVGQSQDVLHQAESYEGPLTASGLAAAIKRLVTDVQIQRVGEGEQWERASEEKASVLLFTEKQETSLLYKSLSWKYHTFASFYEIHSSHQQMTATFKIQRFPTLLVLRARLEPGSSEQGEEVIPYNGEIGALSLGRFLDEVLEVPISAGAVTSELRFLEASDLDRIDGDEEIWLVAFFSDPHGTGCLKSLAEFDETIRRLREIVRIGVYNLTAHPDHDDLEDMDIAATELAKHPCRLTIVRFPFGSEKNADDAYETYTGSLDPKALQSFALEANEIRPLELTEATMSAFLGVPKGSTPRPKVLLFSSRVSCPPLFGALAMSLRHWKAEFGFVPPTDAKLREEFGVRSIPTLVLVYFDPEADEGKQVLAPQYPGPLQFGPMKAWIQALFITLKTERSGGHDPFFVAAERSEVKRVTSDDDVKAVCDASVPLCVFVALDEGHEHFQTHLEWLESFVLQKSQSVSPFSFAWVHAADAPNFLSWFDVGQGDVPAVIVISPKKRRYVHLKRQAANKEVDAFLRAVTEGSEQTYPFQEIPRLRAEETREELEEEISLEELSDVEVQSLSCHIME